MNNVIQTLLSAMIVSLSVLYAPLTQYKENLQNTSIMSQIINVNVMEQNRQNLLESIREMKVLKEAEMKDKMQKDMVAIELIEDQQEWFLAYKDVIFKYVKWFDMPQTIFDTYTEEEIMLMCRAVETECYDQDFISKCNVASVILNRAEQGGEFGNSIIEVITKENQFAYGREDITQSTILSIMYVYEIGDTTDGCIAFRSDRSPETWYGWKLMFTDDAGHHYYKKMEDKNE